MLCEADQEGSSGKFLTEQQLFGFFTADVSKKPTVKNENVMNEYIKCGLDMKLLVAFDRLLHCDKVPGDVTHRACAEVLRFPPVGITKHGNRKITLNLKLILEEAILPVVQQLHSITLPKTHVGNLPGIVIVQSNQNSCACSRNEINSLFRSIYRIIYSPLGLSNLLEFIGLIVQ